MVVSPTSPPPTLRAPPALAAAADARLPLQLTSFVGRERELATVRERLAATRLLTLTGAGGSGKTRLALEIAKRESDAFDGDVAWADLAPVSTGALVAGTVLSALGLSEQTGRSATETLLGALRDRRTLLVLDNCEHVIDASAVLADTLLRACPQLRILATSREALGVGGETAWHVPPLSLPATMANLAGSEAIALFVERARSVVPTFAVGPANAELVARICRRLDGLPLALELAAARLRALSLERIVDRLDDRFRLLTTGNRAALPRQQTLRAAIDWSYDLLSDPERVLLGRLAVFAGSFTFEGAESVCAGGAVEKDDVLDLVAGLVEKSLVTLVDADDDVRYRLLETMREYGLEALARRGEAAEFRARHADFYASLAADAEPHLVSAHRPQWTARLQLDVDNLREALSWSAEADPLLHLRIVGALCWFWYSSGLWTEGRRWLDAALALRAASEPTRERASVLFAAGALAALQGQPEVARPWLEECATLARAFGDQRLEAYASNYVAMTYGQEGDARCVEAAEFALEWSRRTGDLYCHRLALLILGTYHARIGELDRARALMEQAVDVARAFGAERELGIALNCLGATLSEQGDLTRAAELLRESLAAFRVDPQYMFVARSLELLGGIARRSGEVERAAVLLGAGDTIRRSIASTPFKVDGEWIARHIAEGRAAIGAERFDRAMADGAAMSVTQAIDFALSPPVPATAPYSAGTPEPRFTGEYAIPSAAKITAPSALRVRALGGLAIERDGEPLPDTAWSYAKPRELLLFLLCHPGGCTREQVGLAMWPDASAAQLRNNFHVTLHHLRRVLGGPDWVRLEQGRYRLAPERDVDFDATAFESAATAALQLVRRRAPATEQLRAALALYGGEFLDGESMGDWHLELRDRLQRLHADALLALGDALVRDDALVDAEPVLERLVRAEPLNEAAHRALIVCRARMGDQAGALVQYQRLSRILSTELGAKPAAESAALYYRLRQGHRV
jgi:predicted ATPase/DNA-binding SARP family transcriptional activator